MFCIIFFAMVFDVDLRYILWLYHVGYQPEIIITGACFCLQLTSASTKGWKDLSSLWGEPKTTLATADTSPGEKTSLLAMKADG